MSKYCTQTKFIWDFSHAPEIDQKEIMFACYYFSRYCIQIYNVSFYKWYANKIATKSEYNNIYVSPIGMGVLFEDQYCVFEIA